MKSYLAHEGRDNSMEFSTFVMKGSSIFGFSLITSTERSEISSSLGNDIVVEFEFNTAEVFAVSSHIKENVCHDDRLGGKGCA